MKIFTKNSKNILNILRTNNMRIIPTDFIVEINKSIIISNKGVYDNNRLLSVYSTIDYCGTLKEKICSVVRSLIKNHPFIDGNKRTALSVFFILSYANDIIIDDKKNYGEIIENIATNKHDITTICDMLF